MKKTIFSIVDQNSRVEKILKELQEHQFSLENISVLYPDPFGHQNERPDADKKSENLTQTWSKRGFVYERKTKAPEGAAYGTVFGAILGGILGLLMGVGTVAIAGMGPFIAAGPIMATLAGSAVGATIGYLIGLFVGLGFPEIEAVHYAVKPEKEDSTLIAVTVSSVEQENLIRKIFRENGAIEASTSWEIPNIFKNKQNSE